MQQDAYATMRRRLAPLGRRLRISDTLLFASRSLWVAALLLIAITLIGRLTPVPYLHWWAMLPPALWVLVVAVYLLVRPLPPPHIARRLDSTLNLRERLSTALELHTQQLELHPLATLQQEDAAATLQQVQAKQLPLRLDRRLLLAGVVALSLGGLLLLLPNPQDAVLAERQQVREAIAQANEQIEDLKEQISQDETLTPEERAELEKQLAELQEKLRQNPGNREEALADLS